MDNDLPGYLQKVSVGLSGYLEKVLPAIYDDWWQDGVLSSLSFNQRRRLEQQGPNSLSSLDLAALLRILDQNWYQVSEKKCLSPEARHFLKEMQTIRNRWAHKGTDGFPADDIYRDLDTLQRFTVIIEANPDLIQQIATAKRSLLVEQPSPTGAAENSSLVTVQSASDIKVGHIVCLKTDPSVRGAVIEVLSGEPEPRYRVFVDREIRVFYASQITPETQTDSSFHILTNKQFRCYLTALQLRHPSVSTLYSMNSARVDFIPYQFRPVLKFIRSDRPRLLIADGVGVGKTIEAGLILRELQARRDIRSVLIICPRPMVTERKWEIEMKRFEEEFVHLDSKTLHYCITEMDRDGVWPTRYEKVIVPYSLFDKGLLEGTEPKTRSKRKKGLEGLDPLPKFDLVIVDEAHHIRNEATYSYKAVKFFCDHAEAVVFLTATPIQMGSNDLYVLLNVLRPDLIIDKEAFRHMSEPNPYINEAVAAVRSQQPGWTEIASGALEQATNTPWGHAILSDDPEFNSVQNKLLQDHLSAEDRITLIHKIESFHTFSGIINRTRRRDIGDFTIRKPQTVEVPFTDEQKELHDRILEVQADIFRRLHGDINVRFMMTTICRQAASCLFGLAPLLKDILGRHIDELLWDEADDMYEPTSAIKPEKIKTEIFTILDLAKNLEPIDPKLQALKNILDGKQRTANNKVMVFSCFRHTLNYLHTALLNEGFRVGLIHGGTPDSDRVDMRERFERSLEDNDAFDVLLFSEVGCEGLDYQFCDCIVNYDLPWNPMRVEQRIGRIDRRGQCSESVVIFNLVTPGTIDADIYERCLLRIGVFNNALGSCEEILGEIAHEINNIAQNFLLTEEDRKNKFQQLADNKIRLIQEQEELEQEQIELFGIRLPEDQLKKEISDATSFWLSQDSIHDLVLSYLQETLGTGKDFILGEKVLKNLRLSREDRDRLLKDFQRLPKPTPAFYRSWETWLKGDSPYLEVTFDAAAASGHSKAAFIMPLHPLARQAVLAMKIEEKMFTTLKVIEPAISPGIYPFAVYQWHIRGIRDDLHLQVIAESDELARLLPELLERAEDDKINNEAIADVSIWTKLDNRHYHQWSAARDEHIRQTQEIARFRRESLSSSHKARIALLIEQLDTVSNENIQRMRQSQIVTAEADYARRSQEIDIAMERADITAQPVVHGVIRICKYEGGL
ncbi:MAG: Swt1 family HEPN domain-containing protein [Proteobacteria bacterium]|nr:Swt1 family HEPN domain-containing protein [Pseudomonadota bacterium]